MKESAAVNGTPPVPAAPVNAIPLRTNPAAVLPPERVHELLAELAEPFDVAEIKWRVTNTSHIGTRNGPQLRGQMLAYADPRAYTDRLNGLFTPSGWTRDYSVQLAQNFERQERGSTERTIAAKIVVICKVTINGFGVHTGLGEEWADSDNAGTAAEAQAFKRACSCFGLGRYLYDLEGQWVDLDERKRPLETPRLPDWARPKRQQVADKVASAGRHGANSQPRQNGSGAAKNGRGGPYREELLCQVKLLSGTVGFSLTRSVMKTVANVEDPVKIQDMAKLTIVFEKLQDLARGVERLQAAVSKAGEERYSALCRDINLASDSIDDIPDRATLRQLLQTLEGETGTDQGGSGDGHGGAVGTAATKGSDALNDLRGRLLREAARISGSTNRTVAEVIHQAAKGAFSLATLGKLGTSDVAKMEAALKELGRMAVLE